jgi:hypothetical protein
MRTGLTALVLLAFLLGGHLFSTLIVYPEFHTYEATTPQERAAQISQLDSKVQQDLSWELMKGRMNGKRGANLAEANMAVDGISLVIVACLIVKTYRRARKEYLQNKDGKAS